MKRTWTTSSCLAQKSTVIWPVDDWDAQLEKFSQKILAKSEYMHLLKVPLLGQYYLNSPGNHCGKTSAAMVYDFFQLQQHPEDADSYYSAMRIKSGQWDIRFPNGDLSMDPRGLCDSKNIVGNRYRVGAFDGVGTSDVRVHRNDALWIEERFAKIIKSLDHNAPVVIYTRFSFGFGHIIVLGGYLKFDGELWFLVQDPEWMDQGGRRTQKGMYAVVSEAEVDSGDVSRWNEKNAIVLEKGDWFKAGGALYLLKASHIFSDHCKQAGKFYFQYGDYAQGQFIYWDSTQPVAVSDELIFAGARKPLLRFPVEYPSPSPLAYYTTSEQAVAEGSRLPVAGGFYPLGLEGHLHSGVHLPAPDGVPGVVAMAPGEIVAFRVGALDPASDPQKVLEAQGNWGNFVLLRHEYQLGKDKPQSFYSLAMHLAPLSWQQVHGQERLDLQIPWLARLLHARHGVLVKIPTHAHREDEDSVRVLAEPMDPSWVDGIRVLVGDGNSSRPISYWVFENKEFKPASMEVPASTGLNDAVWVYLAPPPHKAALYKAIENGETVFLDGHFQAVETGEVLGKLMPFNAVAKDNRAVGASAFQARSFVHWEVFAKEASVFTEAADDSLLGASLGPSARGPGRLPSLVARIRRRERSHSGLRGLGPAGRRPWRGFKFVLRIR